MSFSWVSLPWSLIWYRLPPESWSPRCRGKARWAQSLLCTPLSWDQVLNGGGSSHTKADTWMAPCPGIKQQRFLHFLGGKQQEGYLAKNILLEHFFFQSIHQPTPLDIYLSQQCPGHYKVVPECLSHGPVQQAQRLSGRGWMVYQSKKGSMRKAKPGFRDRAFNVNQTSH